MDTPHNHESVLAVLAKDFAEHRIPRLMELKERVDGGDVLDNAEFEFLTLVLKDTSQAMPIAADHPDWHQLAAKVAHFLHEITQKALENESTSRA